MRPLPDAYGILRLEKRKAAQELEKLHDYALRAFLKRLLSTVFHCYAVRVRVLLTIRGDWLMRILFLAALSLTACSVDEKGAPGEGIGNKPVADCPVIDSRDWHAWVDAEPGPDAPTLHIRGAVDLPTPGYEYHWRVGIADRALPPGQHMHLDFTAPDGVVAQVVTPMEVAYQGEAAFDEYRMILVKCGGERLAEILDVPVAR